jgi:predicted DCC family thiol-disulfide oxidoreductase YuxK
MAGIQKTRVFMDGSCPFCRAARARIEPFDTHHEVEFIDYRDAASAAEAPFSREALDAEMHVQLPNGSWQIGFFGWAAVLRRLPAWRWLGRLMIAPPFRWFGPSIYRWIARNRYSLPGMPQPCSEHACGLPHLNHPEPAAPKPISR